MMPQHEIQQCKICDKWFLSPRALLRHLNKDHSSKTSNVTGKYPCLFCNTTFTRLTNLRRHHHNIHNDASHHTPTPILVNQSPALLSKITMDSQPLNPSNYKINIVYAPQPCLCRNSCGQAKPGKTSTYPGRTGHNLKIRRAHVYQHYSKPQPGHQNQAQNDNPR